MMQAFIVRPFGKRGGIDFDAVEEQLIQPALAHCDIQGGTTGKILEAGNIREDMFQRLLVADLVVADVSIHNANVFYELGIRHALQPKRTYLLRAKQDKPRSERGPEDEVPFDLRTDRYLEYDPGNPAAALPLFKQALGQTLISERQDSPVFRLLPDLAAQDRSRFLPVPLKFREDVELASKAGQIGLLALLGLEASDFPWAPEGLRIVGREQFNRKAYTGAKITWEVLCRLDPLHIEANQRLGTVYQRMGDLNASDQALQRVLSNKQALPSDRAEALSLLGRNIKERWRLSWDQLTGEQRARQALRSPYLLQAYEKYKQGFEEDLNSFYPGLNALSLLTIALHLAQRMPDLWEGRFRVSADADRELQALEQQRQLLAGAVGSSLTAAQKRLQQSGDEDRWLEISLADYCFLTCERPPQVSYAYESALAGAASFHADSVRAQLHLFEQLEVLPEHVRQALEVFPSAKPQVAPALPPERVVLFTGHMIDAPGRVPSRFPESCQGKALSAIRDALRQEQQRTKGNILGVGSAANGGDILFHEACAELGIPTHVFLPLPPDRFRSESVSPAGPAWEKRFDQLMERNPSPPRLSASDELPSWLSIRPNYNTWQRANLWMIQEALALGAGHFTLLALWDGTTGDGPGGAEHMIRIAKQSGASTIELRTRDIFSRGCADKAEAPGAVNL
jgi:hypothetical protein